MTNVKFLTVPCLFSALLFAASCMDEGDATEKTKDQMQENAKEMNDAKTESTEEWLEERTEAVKELRDLRATMDNHRIHEQERLANLKDATKKAECQAMIAELNINIARIDSSLANMDASTGMDWSDLKADARRTADDTKSWWEKQKEKIDKQTDADKDNDGH